VKVQDHKASDPADPVEEQIVRGSDEGRGGSAPPSFVYALGQIDARFPSLGVEKEFAQASSSIETEGLTDRQILKAAISEPGNRYLARQLCWIFQVQGFETYILVPRDPVDFALLIEAYREDPTEDEVDAVIGTRGQVAPPDACGGGVIPIVAFDQLYSFDRNSLVSAIPRPESVSQGDEDRFRQTAGEVFDRIMRMADNVGATDEHRALNYLAVRSPQIYAAAAEAHAVGASLSDLEVRLSPLGRARRVVDVIFSYSQRENDVTEKHFVRVDVTEEYPFLATKMAPYFESL
jgi:hypothetical protein